jgi:hypothetical protein
MNLKLSDMMLASFNADEPQGNEEISEEMNENQQIFNLSINPPKLKRLLEILNPEFHLTKLEKEFILKGSIHFLNLKHQKISYVFESSQLDTI